MVSKTFRVFYQLIPSALGEIGILWLQKNSNPLIIHIMLPQKDIRITETISKNWPGASEQSHEKLKKLCLQIQNFAEGSPVSFSLPRSRKGSWLCACQKSISAYHTMSPCNKIHRIFRKFFGRIRDEKISSADGGCAVK